MPKAVRKLAYKDKSVWSILQSVLARFDDFDDFTDRIVFPDLTTPIPLVLYLSQREFTKLYSAVLTGADLTYPDQSHDIELLFLQMVGMPMTQLCEAIADCIDESTAVSNSLKLFLEVNNFITQVGNPEIPLPTETILKNLLPVGYVCDDDEAFGMAQAVVVSIHEAVSEVLQLIEVVTNPLELAAEVADNIPGASLLTAGADLAAWIQDSAKEQYDLSWSTVIRDELACLLWCAFKDDCELSFGTVWDLYLEESGLTPPVGDDLESWILYLVTIIFGTDRMTVTSISLLGLLAMRFGGKFGAFVLGIRTFEMMILLSEDEVNSDWDILCDECQPDWCHTEDWTTGELDWDKSVLPAQGAGTYSAGNGWAHEDMKVSTTDERRRAINIEKGFATPFPLMRLTATLNMTRHASLPNAYTEVAWQVDDGAGTTTVLAYLKPNAPVGTDAVHTWENLSGETCDTIRLFYRVSFDITDPYTYGGDILLKTLEICGDGTVPPELV